MKLKCDKSTVEDGFAFSHSRTQCVQHTWEKGAVLFAHFYIIGFVHIHKILVHANFHLKPNFGTFWQSICSGIYWPTVTEFKTDLLTDSLTYWLIHWLTDDFVVDWAV